MADQIRAPYGDIVYANTPTLDNVAKQLYAQQQFRQANQVKENQALDAQMQKEFANIRSVDTPEVVNTYNDLKNAKKQLYFNKDIQKNPLLFNQAQQQANELQAKLNTQINQSKEVKDMQSEMVKDHFKNADFYADDFGGRANALMNTPLSKLQNHPQYGDLTNMDSYRYQGSNTNFNDHLSKAFGQPKKILGTEEPLDKQGIQFKTPVYEYGNAPTQVFEGLVNSLDHKTERDAAYKWKQLKPEDIQNIEQQYAAIPQSKWEQMGLPGPQQIQLHGGSDAEKYMRVLAMQNAVNTQPRLSGYQNRTSELSKMDYQLQRDKTMEAIRHADAKDLILYKKQIDPNDKDLNNAWVESYLQNRIDDAKNAGNNKKVVYTPHTSKNAYEISPDPVIMKAFTRGKSEPDRMYVTEDGKIWPIFYKYGPPKDKDGKVIKGREHEAVVQLNEKGDPIVDEDYSKPMEMEQAKLALGYRGETKKQLSGTMKGTYQGTAPSKGSTHIETLRQKYGY